MRSVKFLWGIVAILLAAVAVLTVLLVQSAGLADRLDNPPSETPHGQEQLVAAIGGKTITIEQLQQRLIDRYGIETINQMLDREAVELEAESMGVNVSPEDIGQELKRMSQGYESEEQFYRTMEEQLGLSRAELQEDVRHKLLLERLALRDVVVTEAEIEKYIREHPEEFMGYVQYHLLKIEVNTPEEAEQIIKEIRGGAEFAKMAREKSVDEYSAANGGDMGWVEERDPHVPYVILDAAAELEVGEISAPIPLGGTYAVIKLQARKEVQRVADSATRERIRKELALQKAPPLNDLVRQLRVKWNAQVLHPALTTGKTGLES